MAINLVADSTGLSIEEIEKEIIALEKEEGIIKEQLDKLLHHMGNLIHDTVPVSDTEVCIIVY